MVHVRTQDKKSLSTDTCHEDIPARVFDDPSSFPTDPLLFHSCKMKTRQAAWFLRIFIAALGIMRCEWALNTLHLVKLQALFQPRAIAASRGDNYGVLETLDTVVQLWWPTYPGSANAGLSGTHHLSLPPSCAHKAKGRSVPDAFINLPATYFA